MPFHADSGVARSQGERPAAVFYPFEHPTPYAMILLIDNLSEKRQNSPPRPFISARANAHGTESHDFH
jgi:hypothetical protein